MGQKSQKHCPKTTICKTIKPKVLGGGEGSLGRSQKSGTSFPHALLTLTVFLAIYNKPAILF